MTVEEKSPAPAFSLASTTGKNISLADLKGKKVVLYFYPKDDTPGCTKEACNFRDGIKDLEDAGAVVLGISPDDVASHEKFQKKFSLPFDLLADTGHAVAEKYGVWKEKSMYGKKYMGIERTTFIIDRKGKIAKIFPKVKVEDHHTEVLEALRNLG
jgi:peroxiredoxin Q/BCP